MALDCLLHERHDSPDNALFTLTSGWKIGLMSTQQQSDRESVCADLPHTDTRTHSLMRYGV